RSPDRSLIHNPNRLHKLGRTGCLINVALRTRRQRSENGLVVRTGAGDDNAYIGTYSFQAGHHIENAVTATGAITQQDEIHVLQARQLFQGRRRQFQIRLIVKEGTKSDKAQGITIDDGDVDHRLLGRRSFHNLGHNCRLAYLESGTNSYQCNDLTDMYSSSQRARTRWVVCELPSSKGHVRGS